MNNEKENDDETSSCKMTVNNKKAGGKKRGGLMRLVSIINCLMMRCDDEKLTRHRFDSTAFMPFKPRVGVVY